MIMLPEMSDRAVNTLCIIDSVFLILSFVAYILVYAGRIKLIQDIES